MDKLPNEEKQPRVQSDLAERKKKLSTQKLLRPLSPELPENLDDWTLKVSHEPTLNDLVHDIHKALMKDESTNKQYRELLRATLDSEAVEGSCSADNFMAAQMIRERAKIDGSPVQGKKLDSITKALGVVLRRYEASRKQRRDKLDGQIVSSNNDE